MIGRLLHIANSYPNAVDKERFYAMKERILKRYGEPDGSDVQHIPGKECWSCGGTGVLWEPGGCYKCMGDGWFKRPVWIVLNRFRLGRFTFHVPRERSYEEPIPNVTRITGYVTHPDYGYRKTEWACIALGLIFDRSLGWKGLCEKWDQQRWLRGIRRRCVDCNRHTWYWRKWRCNHCQRLVDAGRLDEEVPF